MRLGQLGARRRFGSGWAKLSRVTAVLMLGSGELIRAWVGWSQYEMVSAVWNGEKAVGVRADGCLMQRMRKD